MSQFTEPRFRVPGGRVRHRRRIYKSGKLSYGSVCEPTYHARNDWQETEEGSECKACAAKALKEGSEG